MVVCLETVWLIVDALFLSLTRFAPRGHVIEPEPSSTLFV